MIKKRKYASPDVVKVELKPEQAILGTCSASATTTLDGVWNLCSGVDKFDCKQLNHGASDNAATS